MKKKALIIVGIVLVVSISILTSYFLFFRKKNVDPLLYYGIIDEKSLNYDFISEANDIYIVQKNGKYGMLDTNYDVLVDVQYDSLIVTTDDAIKFSNTVSDSIYGVIFYIYNYKGQLLISGDTVELISNYYGDSYFYKLEDGNKFTVYNMNGEKVYYGNDVPVYTLDKYWVFDDYLYNIETKEKIKYKNSMESFDCIIFEKEDNCLIFNYVNGTWKEYDSFDGFKNNESHKIKGNYYLSYKECNVGSYLVTGDGTVLVGECAYNYDLSLADKGIYLYDVDGEKKGVFSNGTVINGSINGIIGDYIEVDDKEIIFYSFDGNKVNPTCYLVSYVDGKYICSDGYNKFFVDKEFKIVSDKFLDIECLENYCVVKNENDMYALYKDGLLTNYIYYDYKAFEDVFFGNLVNGIDALKMGYATEVLNGMDNGEQFSEYSERELIDIIYKYDLNSIKDYIMNDKQLFTEYAKRVIDNKKIGDYTKYVLLLFKAVSINKEYINMHLLFDAVEELGVKKVNSLIVNGGAGIYNPTTKEVNVIKDTPMVLMHELIHFLDYNINTSSSMYYDCGDDILIVNDIRGYEYLNNDSCKVVNSYNKLLVEAGAEYYSGVYYRDKFLTSYYDSITIFNFLENVYGVDTMRDIFYSKDGEYKLYKELMQSGLTANEAIDFVEKSSYITDFNNVYSYENVVSVCDYIVKIINNKYGIKWYEDNYFKYIINSIIKDKAIIYSSVNKGDYNKYLSDYWFGVVEKIIKDVNTNYSVYSNSITIVSDGDSKYISMYAYVDGDCRNLIVEYDFKEEKVISYKLSDYVI